jgi:hypothetical protein
MEFNHGEFPREIGEEFEPEAPEGNLDWIITIEFEKAPEPETLIIDKVPEYVRPDHYLDEHLERERQEELNNMVPKPLP